MYNKALLLIKHRQISIYKKSQNIKSPYFINNHQHNPFIIEIIIYICLVFVRKHYSLNFSIRLFTFHLI